MSERKYKLPLSELIDKLTITQLREMLLEKNREFNTKELSELQADIDTIINESGININSRMLRIVILIGQLNTLIWVQKDLMELFPDQYDKYLRLAHQINGLKNQLKNMLSETGKTNIKTDGLSFFISL
jgi:predicted oxidoreductase (fatty acid repression mutant protein)